MQAHLTSSGANSTGSETTTIYLVTWINKPMPCLDPQTPQGKALTNKTAGIQGFVEASMLETHSRVRGFFYPTGTHEYPGMHDTLSKSQFSISEPPDPSRSHFHVARISTCVPQLWLAETPASGLGRTNPAFQCYAQHLGPVRGHMRNEELRIFL
jgi:hypothetical protein